ncbi:MAG: DUF4352 domain-containing protein [Anaerolineae bacterium]|nr:DUF4352 domain-containing protein [Anaerolineae bacterium]
MIKFIPKLIVTLFVALLVTACNSQPKTGVVGQKIDYKGYGLTLTQIKIADDFPGARKARAGYKLVAVEMLVESNTSKGVSVSPKHIKAVDSNGRDYEARAATGLQPAIREEFDIPKGQKRQGWVTFEVPDGLRKLTFVSTLPKEFSNIDLSYALELKAQ